MYRVSRTFTGEMKTIQSQRGISFEQRSNDDIKCKICGESAYELQLCKEHLDDYYYWRNEVYGCNSTVNAVDKYVILLESLK